MARVTEGMPGEVEEVWVRDRGDGAPRSRGTVLIEDLADVLTCIASRSGANGPQNPVTQYILSEAANYLAERLVVDVAPAKDGREPVPRMLSSALGHQPFIESVLNMSQHQMLRRWPLATDWYQDVISYVLRPSRFDRQDGLTQAQFDQWATGPFGDFLRQFADAAFVPNENPRVLRMAEALQSLWPDYPPVKAAMLSYRRSMMTIWAPRYEAAVHRYGLRLCPEFSLEEIAWAFNAIQARETFERLADPEMPHHVAADGTRWTMTARAGLMLVAGAVTDLEGRPLSYTELVDRMPVGSADG